MFDSFILGAYPERYAFDDMILFKEVEVQEYDDTSSTTASTTPTGP